MTHFLKIRISNDQLDYWNSKSNILISSIVTFVQLGIKYHFILLNCNLILNLFWSFPFLSWWLHRESSKRKWILFQMFSTFQVGTTVSFFIFKSSSPAPKKLLQSHATFHFGGSPTWLYLLRLWLLQKRIMMCGGTSTRVLH